MPDQLQLKVRIVVEGDFKVGANPQPANRFTVSVTNTGGSVSRPAGGGHIYLRGCLGTDAKALFLDQADARACTQAVSSGWKAVWTFPAEAQQPDKFALKLQTYNSTLFKKNETLTLTLSDVISKTMPGTADLFLETDMDSEKRPVPLTKKSDQPGIINFSSDPPEHTPNLPDDPVTLKWCTHELTNRELTQVGISNPVPCDFSSDEGQRTVKCTDADMTFRLSGYVGDKRFVRELQVRTLDKGWHDLKHTLWEGDPGFPTPQDEGEADLLDAQASGLDLEPLCLFNANDQHLYAIFRRRFNEQQTSFVFKTANPFGPWQFVPTRATGEQGAVPEASASSPGIYFDDTLWLIGGSRINPDNVSNTIWCLELKDDAKKWKLMKPAPWKPRMGHGVVIFQNRIWVMGGRDAAGNALKDVWALDKEGGWEKKADADWAPRCLFASAEYAERIWVYGGMPEPFADTLYRDLYTYDGQQWLKEEMTGSITADAGQAPFAAAIQEFSTKLRLFGKFRSVDPGDASEHIEPLAFTLSNADTKTWEDFPVDALKDWGGDTSFSYQLVNYKNKMLMGLILGYEQADVIMKVYVPG